MFAIAISTAAGTLAWAGDAFTSTPERVELFHHREGEAMIEAGKRARQLRLGRPFWVRLDCEEG